MHNIYLYILVMALVTYLIRMLPLTLIRNEIKSKYIKSFLYYVPYATLAAMTFPAILHASDDVRASAMGFLVALILSYRKKSLLTVAACACIVVFVAELFLV
ncbi:AzlD domain-containing protein [Butyrivibrio sp. NC2002]|uniref:AzlD domain-containing protein n=1 Tax=Butyrivibrio sp. NC2002 TaxID=1410610 RepID=UPI00056B57C8|nr:AzlD domain-containing protein [Butyrivibrio sp. NC2002]